MCAVADTDRQGRCFADCTMARDGADFAEPMICAGCANHCPRYARQNLAVPSDRLQAAWQISVPLKFLPEAQQHVTVTRFRMAPAGEAVPAKGEDFPDRCVLGAELLAGLPLIEDQRRLAAVSLDTKAVRPRALRKPPGRHTPANVDHIFRKAGRLHRAGWPNPRMLMTMGGSISICSVLPCVDRR